MMKKSKRLSTLFLLVACVVLDLLSRLVLPITPIILTVIRCAAVVALVELGGTFIACHRIQKIYRILSSVVFFILLVFAAIFFISYTSLYHPNHSTEAYYRNLSRDGLSEVRIPIGRGEARGWFRPSPHPNSPAIIYFYGNGMNAAQEMDRVLSNDEFSIFDGYHFMVVDYPGYGLSAGHPTNQSINHMADAVYAYTASIDGVDSQRISVMGYSLGTAVATYTAANAPVNGLILIAPFDEAKSMFNNTVNIFHGPMAWMMTEKFPSARHAKAVPVPPLIIASAADELIPYEFSLALADCFAFPPVFVTQENTRHSFFWSNLQTYEAIADYLATRPA